LGPAGRYEGLDVAEPLLTWCRENIESRLTNFRFTLADVRALPEATESYDATACPQVADFVAKVVDGFREQ
jgi:ubiquinone/menaquinone biosynthesis C-methylase UbiE